MKRTGVRAYRANTVNLKPTRATYERARRLANVAVWSVELQCRRLQSVEPEDATFVLRKWADFDFLVVALTRLRRAAQLAASIPELNATSVERSLSPVSRWKCRRLTKEGPTLHWLGNGLNAPEALHASQRLFAAIQDGARLLRRDS